MTVRDNSRTFGPCEVGDLVTGGDVVGVVRENGCHAGKRGC